MQSFKGGPSTCRLCTLAGGNLRDFVLTCSALSEARDNHLTKIASIVCNIQGNNHRDILQMILDPQVINSDIQPDTLEELLRISRRRIVRNNSGLQLNNLFNNRGSGLSRT